MLINIGFEIVFDNPNPVNMLLMLYVRPEKTYLLRKPEIVTLNPYVPLQTYIDKFGNRVGRLYAPAGRLTLSYDNVVEDSGLLEPSIDGLRVHPVEELPAECMEFLVASRYCEVDRMNQMAWDLFGSIPPGTDRVHAVVDWAHRQVKFGYQYARPTKTAYDAYVERQGVCRDYQHLAITMLRSLNIPARYATGYLGDIGVPYNPAPMDFSAWFEVYLGGYWRTMDARHNVPRIGRILQAVGRDAVDVALTTSFGPSNLVSFKVWTTDIAG